MKIRCAVIGVGYLGRFHAQKLKSLPDVELVAICDIDKNQANLVAKELGVEACINYQDLIGKVDAVIIASTTISHFKIAEVCLMRGIHVLVEKPITETVAEANTLIALAHKNKLKLQVGHLERFNPARIALEPYLANPLFIESTRLAPFNPRGSDVNVILDLMIHDIDIIQTLVKSPIMHIDAQGAPVISPSLDIANARINFQNHCVANVTASRVSYKTERKMRIFQYKSYISIDFHQKKFAVFTKGNGEMFPGIPNIVQHEEQLPNNDALLAEVKSFIDCIKQNTTPVVTGEEGRDALATAHMITDLITHHHTAVYQEYEFEA
ncbi:MAG: UDP-N-acetyl-D-glucosamine dehydrogenase [Legionellales bacterium RIFCSPHIGHO2_12_FULL_37_14]|nr:MAG: UDP-N-acetyl-D-glucosamine dehydrogenase [Legionellales bacterium RIFCSPHIGHO2_12_FULL_37_14]